MAEYKMFVDWLVSSTLKFWSFWMNAHFVFKALLLSPLLWMVVRLIYDTFHSDV